MELLAKLGWSAPRTCSVPCIVLAHCSLKCLHLCWAAACMPASLVVAQPWDWSSTELKLLEEATISVCRTLVENNPRTGNLGALIKVFLSRTKELKLSAECQNHIFIWQTHNALFIICCLLKVFICEMSEEELQLHFTYEEKSPGSYSKSCLRWRSGGSMCNIRIEFEK